MKKPVLILQLRPEDNVQESELNAFLNFGGIPKEKTHVVRMEKEGLPEINLDDYSAVFVGGGPSNVSDWGEKDDGVQCKFFESLCPLIKEIVERDFPYLGMCYGLGILSKNCGGNVSKEKYGEPVSAVDITLTPDAKIDDLLKDLPNKFRAFVGHKESCQIVPDNAVLLASSEVCPVHMVRIKNNVYATQFHPELDSAGIILRAKAYKDHGYFKPEELDNLISKFEKENIFVPQEILKRFVNKYCKS